MTLQSEVFNIAGKGQLTVDNFNGNAVALEGNIKERSGNNVFVSVNQEGEASVMQKNPYHRVFYYDYISAEIYNDNELGKQYYWGYEHVLQVLIGYYDNAGEFTFNETASELFDETALKELKIAVNSFCSPHSLK
ncbi:hypothetical protein BXO87_01840 [Bacillus sp. GZB]|uniref:hypothetical protein n=1 Tax=Bacillus TaxID=1386 RepID=UPI0009782ABA|nr:MULTISPECIES: hypothetical protein [Bacillus]MCZ4246870.1 hypothetical protein [Bacillus amyloliquefaciens]OMQ06771.1 hypothetical protein BXO87_01840 [Bacillus sp. GZB]